MNKSCAVLRLFLFLVFVPLAGFAALLAHYTFDVDYGDSSPNGSGGTLVDAGTPGNSGITSNAAERVFGTGALHLSTDRDYVSVTSRTFGSGNPYTIAFWARKSGGDSGGAAQWDMVAGQRDSTGFFIALGNGAGTPGLRWRSVDSSAARQADFTSVADTNWHHHVIAANNASNIFYYLDGALVAVASNKLTGFILDTIGEAYTNGAGFDFNGQLDEVWVFNETLGAATVTNLYLYNQVVAPDTNLALVLHCAFEGDYADLSMSSNHGTASGAATLLADPVQAPVGSGALQLDGADNSYIALTTNLTLTATQAWSVAFWAKRAETGAQHGMVVGERGTTDDFIWLNDNFAGLRFRSSTTQTVDLAAPKDTALHHYALVAGGTSNLFFYLDGVLVRTTNANTSFTINTVGQAYSGLSYAFSGLLDDVRVYTGALGDAGVLALYQMHTNGPSVTNAPDPIKRVRVILQAGQSNSDGRGEPAGLPSALQSPQSNILFYYREASESLTTLRPGTSASSQFGPEVTCGAGYDGYVANPSTRVALIKYAVGGTTLYADWKPGGDGTTAGDGPYYVTFQQTVSNGLAALRALHTGAVISIDGMTWMQGESDDGVATTYATNLAAFIADVRATIQSNLPFVIGRLSTGQTAVASLSVLRTAQVNVATADPYTEWVDTDSFGVKSSDHLHFDATGQVALGYAFAYRIFGQQDLAARFSPAQIAGGQAEPDADADGDGVSNGAEFIGGTDATNSASVLAVRIAMTGGVVQVTYPSASGRRFAVDTQPEAGGTNWIVVLPFAPGTGTHSSLVITNAAGTGVWRVRAALP